MENLGKFKSSGFELKVWAAHASVPAFTTRSSQREGTSSAVARVKLTESIHEIAE